MSRLAIEGNASLLPMVSFWTAPCQLAHIAVPTCASETETRLGWPFEAMKGPDTTFQEVLNEYASSKGWHPYETLGIKVKTQANVSGRLIQVSERKAVGVGEKVKSKQSFMLAGNTGFLQVTLWGPQWRGPKSFSSWGEVLFSKSEQRGDVLVPSGNLSNQVDEVRNFVIGCIRNITTMLGIIVHKAGNL